MEVLHVARATEIMTKLSRSRTCRQGNSPERALDGLLRSPSSLFRLILHGLLCIAALVLGFRLSREGLIVVVSFKAAEGTFFPRGLAKLHSAGRLGEGHEAALGFPHSKKLGEASTQLRAGVPAVGIKSSRVHVGRHEILIRPWPHPDPVQTIVAHRLMELVQREQQRSYGLEQRRRLLIITPTYVRTFQALHLTGLIHTLRIAPRPVIWIVVEAGGVTNETASLLSSSQLSFHHLGFPEAMPAVWEEQEQLETRLRIEGLRFIHEQRLEGIVLFADDSNTYSLDFFDEVQKMKYIGAFTVGVLSHSGLLGSSKEDPEATHGGVLAGAKEGKNSGLLLPLQGPVCDSSERIIGWYANKDETGTSSKEMGSPKSLNWAGFAINAKLLWEDGEKPSWIMSWNELFRGSGTSIQSPLSFAMNASLVEPLGNCGRDVLVWWHRVEARADSKFPSKWVIHPSLEIVAPSKHTPWPDLSVGHPTLPPVPMPSDIANQHEKHRSKQGGAKGGRGK